MKSVGRLVILALLALTLTLGVLWAQSRTPGTAVTRTQRVELVDKDGKIRAEVKTIGEDTVLALYDGQGRLRTLVGTENIVFYGADGKIMGRIEAKSLQIPEREGQ